MNNNVSDNAKLIQTLREDESILDFLERTGMSESEYMGAYEELYGDRNVYIEVAEAEAAEAE